MPHLATVLNMRNGAAVCERCLVANGFRSRLRGLLGRGELPRDEGVLLESTSAVHMAFMRFAIDAVFLDRDLRVVEVVSGLRPWRWAARRGSRAVLELAAGEGERRSLRAGDPLRVIAIDGPLVP